MRSARRAYSGTCRSGMLGSSMVAQTSKARSLVTPGGGGDSARRRVAKCAPSNERVRGLAQGARRVRLRQERRVRYGERGDGAGACMKLSDLPFEAIGGQPAFTPAELERFVAAPRIGVLGYVRRNGTTNQVPIWYAYEDGCLKMTTTANSPKAKALARDPRASLMIQDETPPYRAVVVDGRVKIGPTPVKGGTSSGLAVRYF